MACKIISDEYSACSACEPECQNDAIVELDGPPAFDYGEKVISRMNVRNDGTFIGAEVGAVLVKKGEVGYVKSIGSFLQQFYIYGVDFVDHGVVVGMKARELASLDHADDSLSEDQGETPYNAS